MTYEEKKAWLRRYRHAVRMEAIKLEEVEQLRTAAQRVTQVLSDLPGGTGDGQAIPRAVERIEKARQAAEAQSIVCDTIREELMDVFSQLDNEVDFMILFRRYVLLEDWKAVAAYTRLTSRWVFTRHRAAIEQLEIKDSIKQQ